jgi:hypothetical protein
MAGLPRFSGEKRVKDTGSWRMRSTSDLMYYIVWEAREESGARVEFSKWINKSKKTIEKGDAAL